MAIRSEEVTINGKHGSFGGYLALPEGGADAGVIVIQEIFGVNVHIRDVTERVANAGYAALAPDLFWQVEPGFQAGYTDADIAKGREYKDRVDPDRAADDVASAMDTLRGRSELRGERIGVTGFCWGGLMTYLAACRLNPTCSVAYYGGGIANFLGEASKNRTPLMFHFGEQDAAIPMDQVEQIKQTFRGRDDVIVYTYPEAGHGFHCDRRGSYHEPSAKLAWERTLDFFTRHLQG